MIGDDTRTLGDMGKLGNGEWNGKDRGSWGTKGEMGGCQRVTGMGRHWKTLVKWQVAIGAFVQILPIVFV
jgi:hypothetical protein